VKDVKEDGPSQLGQECHWCKSFLKRIMPGRFSRTRRLYWRGKYFCAAKEGRDSCLQKFLERGFMLPAPKMEE